MLVTVVGQGYTLSDTVNIGMGSDGAIVSVNITNPGSAIQPAP